MKVHFAFPLALALVAPAASAACYRGPSAVESQTEAVYAGQARVVAHGVSGNIFRFSVENLSHDNMVVDRDAVRLGTNGGSRGRLPGGADSTYTIPPGGAHDVNVKFDLSGLSEGEEVSVQFGSAIHVAGLPVPVDPIGFTIQ
jgi:hypothetical protein